MTPEHCDPYGGYFSYSDYPGVYGNAKWLPTTPTDLARCRVYRPWVGFGRPGVIWRPAARGTNEAYTLLGLTPDPGVRGS